MLNTQQIPETKPCPRCKGTGTEQFHWDGIKHGPGPCKRCEATGIQYRPDFNAIFDLVTKKSKDGKRSFRKAKPDLKEWHNTLHGQAYFVWRLARFHGGADVTMPVNATLCVHQDAYYDELDAFASLIAKSAFGTDLAASYRWYGALGGSQAVPDGLPASAYPCGPVADEHKPETEFIELT